MISASLAYAAGYDFAKSATSKTKGETDDHSGTSRVSEADQSIVESTTNSGKSAIRSERVESPRGHILLVIGDAAEVIDTVYPLMRLQEAGYQVVVAKQFIDGCVV